MKGSNKGKGKQPGKGAGREDGGLGHTNNRRGAGDDVELEEVEETGAKPSRTRSRLLDDVDEEGTPSSSNEEDYDDDVERLRELGGDDDE